MYVTSAIITDFRCLQNLEIKFAYGDRSLRLPNVTLLIGRNGSGKTSVLRGIAIGLIGWALEGYRSYYNVRRGAEEASITLHVEPDPSDTAENELCAPGSSARLSQAISSFGAIEKLAAGGEPSEKYRLAMQDEQDPKLFIAGYGAARRVETGEYDAATRGRMRHARYRRVASLLDPQYTLVPLSSWIPKLPPAERKSIGALLTKLLPKGGLKFDAHAENDLYFVRGDQKLPFDALSDGYQAFLGWIGDLLYHLHECAAKVGRIPLEKMHGIVLVDEIDLHLHPRWQQEVIRKLSRVFPQLQFVLTTHSPLVVGSVESVNVRVLQEKNRGKITVSTPAQEVYGLTADQILLSPSFGLVTVREAEFMRQLKQTEKRARSGDRGAALQFNRMVAFGAAGIAPPSDDDIPDWVRELAARKNGESGEPS